MDFLTWGRDPWDQPILIHLSCDLFWASLFAGAVFLVAHASYMVLSAHRKRHVAETDAMEAARTDLPDRIIRHSLTARIFHWVMAATMFTLPDRAVAAQSQTRSGGGDRGRGRHLR